MIFKDYYKILGFDTNKITSEEIKIAFRNKAKKFHPDVNRENSNAEERFKDINEAYKILSDSVAKRKYDRVWYSNVGKRIQSEKKEPRASAFDEIKSMFFGIGNKTETLNKSKEKIPCKGEDIETEINVKIEDAYFGLEKKISLRTVERKN